MNAGAIPRERRRERIQGDRQNNCTCSTSGMLQVHTFCLEKGLKESNPSSPKKSSRYNIQLIQGTKGLIDSEGAEMVSCLCIQRKQ